MKGIVLGGKNSRSFVLRTSILAGAGVGELHIDWQVKMVPASPGWWGRGGASLPKCRYVGRVVSPNSYLAPDHVCSSCCKLGQLPRVILGLFL